MRPGGVGISRMMLSAVTLFPEPDSPTMPSVSPRLMWKSIPSTARTTPSSVKKYVFSPLTSSSRSAMAPPLAATIADSPAAARLARLGSQTRLAARVAEPPRPPLGSHDWDHRLASRHASQSLRGRRSARTTGITDSPRGARRRASAAAARLALPYLEHVVERVALDRDLAGVLDHAEELLAREPGRRLGPRHVLHALVLERAVDVVGAEVKCDRRGRLAEEHPVRLDVREVVQEKPRRGDRPEIVGGRRRPLHEPGRSDLVGEGNRSEEHTSELQS